MYHYVADELLKCTGDVVDVLLDVSDELCQDWASSELVLAMLEAVQQIGSVYCASLPFCLLFCQVCTYVPTDHTLMCPRTDVPMDQCAHGPCTNPDSN